MLTSFIYSFVLSFGSSLLIIRSYGIHGHLSGDLDLDAPQKIHNKMVCRVGGIAVFIGLLGGTLVALSKNSNNILLAKMIICSLPVFTIGIAEDVLKNIPIKVRLLVTITGACFSTIILGVTIDRLNIYPIDYLLELPAIAILLSLFAITGLVNAYNMIDGQNGLASMIGILTLLALGYISYKNHDSELLYASLIMASALLGFFVLNYPNGLIYLGDGGAYLSGFWIALLSILLVKRHENISPWFALLVNIYPIMETTFTIYRRKIHQGKSPGSADGMHIHSLIFRRILAGSRGKPSELSNSLTSPYLWILSFLGIAPAILWPESSIILMIISGIFIFAYILLYRSIVRFNVPSWLKIIKRHN